MAGGPSPSEQTIQIVSANPSAAAARKKPPAPSDGPMAKAAGVDYLERVVGDSPPETPLPMVIALHGLGGKPQNLDQVMTAFGVKARLIFPAGFDPYSDGFAWFPAGSLGDEDKLAAGTTAAAARLRAMIEELTKTKPTKGKVLVTGFSQGGMLSYTLAVLHPDVVGAAFPIGGLLPSKLLPAAWPEGKPRPPIKAFHGDADDRVPISGDRASVEGLKKLGFTAELKEYPALKHTIAPWERRDVLKAIEDAALAAK